MVNFKKRLDELVKWRTGKSSSFQCGVSDVVAFNAITLAEELHAEMERLRQQLPESMGNRKILFEECEVGHGMLRGENWIKHPCIVCERNQLRTAADKMKDALEMLSKRPIATWYSRHETNDCGYYAGWDDAEYAVKQALTAYEQARGEQSKQKQKYKCDICCDTGRITWTDYSNGQGLDMDREDDCHKCQRG